jgi:hypothetical protein
MIPGTLNGLPLRRTLRCQNLLVSQVRSQRLSRRSPEHWTLRCRRNSGKTPTVRLSPRDQKHVCSHRAKGCWAVSTSSKEPTGLAL